MMSWPPILPVAMETIVGAQLFKPVMFKFVKIDGAIYINLP